MFVIEATARIQKATLGTPEGLEIPGGRFDPLCGFPHYTVKLFLNCAWMWFAIWNGNMLFKKQESKVPLSAWNGLCCSLDPAAFLKGFYHLPLAEM